MEPKLQSASSAPNSHALRMAFRPRSRPRNSLRRQLAGGIGNVLCTVARRFAIRVRQRQA